MTLMSGSVGVLCIAVGPSVGHARFEFILPLQVAAGVAVSGVAVLVKAWAERSVPAQAGKVGQPSPSVMLGGANAGFSGWKTTLRATWKKIREALVASAMFWFTLVVSLGAVGACGLPLGVGV